jgi:hypothetical protein
VARETPAGGRARAAHVADGAGEARPDAEVGRADVDSRSRQAHVLLVDLEHEIDGGGRPCSVGDGDGGDPAGQLAEPLGTGDPDRVREPAVGAVVAARHDADDAVARL